jgi:hypothetical protein
MSADRRDLDSGAAFAEQIMPSIAFLEGQATSQLLWWAGFIGGIAGGMTASIGSEAAQVLVEAVNHAGAKVLQKKAN